MVKRTCEYCIHYGDGATYPNTGYCFLGHDYVKADDTCISWDDEEEEED